MARGEGLGKGAEGASFGEVVAVSEKAPGPAVRSDGSDVRFLFFVGEIEASEGFLVRIGVGEELPRAEARAGGGFIFPIGAVGGVGGGVGVCGGRGWFGWGRGGRCGGGGRGVFWGRSADGEDGGFFGEFELGAAGGIFLFGVGFGGDKERQNRPYLIFAEFGFLFFLFDEEESEEAAAAVFAEEEFDLLGFACFPIHPVAVNEVGFGSVFVGIALHKIDDGVFVDMVFGFPSAERLGGVPVGFEDGATVDGDPEQVVGFTNETELT